jgi:hypothetical protein
MARSKSKNSEDNDNIDDDDDDDDDMVDVENEGEDLPEIDADAEISRDLSAAAAAELAKRKRLHKRAARLKQVALQLYVDATLPSPATSEGLCFSRILEHKYSHSLSVRKLLKFSIFLKIIKYK